MTYATIQWSVTLRVTESAPNTPGTADVTMSKYWVKPGSAAQQKIDAENNAKEQFKNMLTGNGLSTTILSSAATGVTR